MSSKGVNKVLLIGNVCHDPEIRYTKEQLPIANMSVATNDFRKGEKVTEYHKCVAFGDLVEKFIKPYLKKGNTVYIEGSLQTKSFTDKQTGVTKYSTQIVVRDLQSISNKRVEEETEEPDQQTAEEFIDDDVPF